MEVLYHTRPYFVGIFPYIGLIYGRYLHFRILKFALNLAFHQSSNGEMNNNNVVNPMPHIFHYINGHFRNLNWRYLPYIRPV